MSNEATRQQLGHALHGLLVAAGLIREKQHVNGTELLRLAAKLKKEPSLLFESMKSPEEVYIHFTPATKENGRVGLNVATNFNFEEYHDVDLKKLTATEHSLVKTFAAIFDSSDETAFADSSISMIPETARETITATRPVRLFVDITTDEYRENRAAHVLQLMREKEADLMATLTAKLIPLVTFTSDELKLVPTGDEDEVVLTGNLTASFTLLRGYDADKATERAKDA